MPINLLSVGGGTTTLTTASSASNFTVTIPAATGEMVTTAATQTLTNKTLGSGYGGGAIVSGTAVASTSGASIDFTSIPSWVKRITVMFSGVSTNGASPILLQLGDSGGVENTGYLSNGYLVAVGASQSTAGFIFGSGNASNLITGQMEFTQISSSTNSWVGTGMFFINQGGTYYTANNTGSKSLSATLDRVRITTVNGTDAFDAGSINILYE